VRGTQVPVVVLERLKLRRKSTVGTGGVRGAHWGRW